MGCPGDWQPDCDQAQLTRDTNDDIWKTDYHRPGRLYAYKVAINKKWDENYGAGGAIERRQHRLHHPGGNRSRSSTTTAPRTSRTPPRAIWSPRPATSSPSRAVAADWSPDCLRAWLGDPDGDEIFTWTGTDIPTGDYEFKIALNRGWDVNYGDGGGWR